MSKLMCIKLSEKAKILKNLFAFIIVFFLLISSVNGIATVQSVLNKNEGLGIASLLMIFVVQVIFSIAIPQVLTKSIGFKWTMVIAEVFFATYISLNAYPRWYTLMPTSFLAGIGQALVFTITGIYVSILSEKYAEITEDTFSNVQAKFLGIFSSVALFTYVFGSFIVAVTLQTQELKSNGTFDYELYCGANNCPYHKLQKSTSEPTIFSVYILCATLLFVCLLSILVTILFVDNISQDTEESKNSSATEKNKNYGYVYEIKALVKALCNVDMLLLFPIAVYSTLECSFLWNELNRSFATCLFNVKYVGYTSMVFGAVGTILSPLYGYATKYTSQIAFIVYMLMTSFANCIFMLAWIPSQKIYILFLIAAGFGSSAAYGNSQIRGLFSVFVSQDPAVFSAASLFQSVGFCLGLLLSLFTCTYVKLYVYIGVIGLSLVSYLVLIARRNSAIKSV